MSFHFKKYCKNCYKRGGIISPGIICKPYLLYSCYVPFQQFPKCGLEPLMNHGIFAGAPPMSCISSSFSAPKLYKYSLTTHIILSQCCLSPAAATVLGRGKWWSWCAGGTAANEKGSSKKTTNSKRLSNSAPRRWLGEMGGAPRTRCCQHRSVGSTPGPMARVLLAHNSAGTELEGMQQEHPSWAHIEVWLFQTNSENLKHQKAPKTSLALDRECNGI